MSTKVDFKKALKHLYNPPKGVFHIVEVPAMNFLMLDGKGDPNTSEDYQQAVEGLYTISYGIKFSLKPQGFDHIVPPLEGLWWMENMDDFTLANKASWEWTMMIMQPEWVAGESVDKVIHDAIKKKKLPSLGKIRFGRYLEGISVQYLYTGAYENEAPMIAEMHKYVKNNGYQTHGKHHEIYLGDPRKISPEKLQTILRQPIRK
jgi:hypothetical protein